MSVPGVGLPVLSAVPSARRVDPLEDRWLEASRRARLLSWVSVVWMTAEGTVGVLAGIGAASVALIGWGIGSAIEGAAAVIVIWRFTGSRVYSPTAERRAGRAVAASLFLLAAYIAVAAVRSLASGEHPSMSVLGIAITGSSVVLMPALGIGKRRLGHQLGSDATAGEGTQNLLCAAQGAAVLLAFAANAVVEAWWADGTAALVLAAFALKEGRDAWRGEDCCAASSSLRAGSRVDVETDACAEEHCCAP